MKILFLYSYFPSFTTNHWLNIDFARAMAWYPGVELKVYGLRAEVGYSDVVLCQYSPDYTLDIIKRIFDFDLVVCYTKSRMFTEYLPPLYSLNKTQQEKRGDCWMPPDFKRWKKTPKIMIEEDYHYEINDDWYYDEKGFDMIMQRHWSQAQRKGKVPVAWLPFSVDTHVFKPNPQTDLHNRRIKRICFNGSQSPVYTYRNEVRAALRKTGLLDDFSFSKRDQEYIHCLQNYIAHLSCSSAYNITPAKMFEIMASGSLLWTNVGDNYGLNELFPSDCYMTYSSSLEDIKEGAKRIIKEEDLRKRTTDKAMECIINNHTHEIRIDQFFQILKTAKLI